MKGIPVILGALGGLGSIGKLQTLIQRKKGIFGFLEPRFSAMLAQGLGGFGSGTKEEQEQEQEQEQKSTYVRLLVQRMRIIYIESTRANS